ncbi:uncharacterized protein METZ01_LOCUS364441 [marine metagenome]|uniref:Uncharacterized protein n=1 Tax=marine metagenome TaxID=408172 RepID=A0A382SQV4_9ZZZZ
MNSYSVNTKKNIYLLCASVTQVE